MKKLKSADLKKDAIVIILRIQRKAEQANSVDPYCSGGSL